MTVAELIAELTMLDADMPVVVWADQPSDWSGIRDEYSDVSDVSIEVLTRKHDLRTQRAVVVIE